ncbi:hypothetical protein J2S19_000368 [Metabacillus malikii]|uniref:Uncharacterized protein n=1 Tax=Metabacillus malikii TaxID=1504265 RepID=A0ABT9ZA51_9BACI|nr:DUF3231 family protein [Metabacillus malikii]MDQ0229118.1 hypothetical protein [Metabacillus malikii]
MLTLQQAQNVKLTSAEIAALWTQYVNETASICFHKHMMEHIEDAAILNVFEYGMSLSNNHLEKIKEFFQVEGFPFQLDLRIMITLQIPHAFFLIFYACITLILCLYTVVTGIQEQLRQVREQMCENISQTVWKLQLN